VRSVALVLAVDLLLSDVDADDVLLGRQVQVRAPLYRGPGTFLVNREAAEFVLVGVVRRVGVNRLRVRSGRAACRYACLRGEAK
jgi:hypothetical protein